MNRATYLRCAIDVCALIVECRAIRAASSLLSIAYIANDIQITRSSTSRDTHNELVETDHEYVGMCNRAGDAPFFCLHISHARPTLRFLWLLPPTRTCSSSSDDIPLSCVACSVQESQFIESMRERRRRGRMEGGSEQQAEGEGAHG